MRLCDICKSDNVAYNDYAITSKDGKGESLELCPGCYRELQARQRKYEHLAYTETVQARNGEIPRKSHWWDIFTR